MRSESAIQTAVRLELAKRNCQMWRNNVGACVDQDGRHIRYGLCNESKQLNEKIKSSDLIGITPVSITPQMVGQVLGVFTAIETKREGWHMTPGDERAKAQAAYHDIVRAVGGYAGFATCEDDLLRIISNA